MTIHGDRMTQAISNLINVFFRAPQYEITDELLKQRRNTYLLSYVGEIEAIGRAKLVQVPVKLNKHDMDFLTVQEVPNGGSIWNHVAHALNRLRQKILDAVQLSKIQGETVEEAMARVQKTFPKLYRFRNPKKAITPLKKDFKEAKAKREDPFSIGFVDPNEWESMLDDYLTPYAPEIRDPELYFDIVGSKLEDIGIDEGEWMGWEIEKLITNDFVQTVRDGQNDAANAQGITDVVWITVFGPATCESCQWRNGLTTTEIEAKLDGDEQGDDYPDVSVPPAHPSCRCQLAPMIDDMPEGTPEGLGDFSEWLK